jgi:hypothetical protein
VIAPDLRLSSLGLPARVAATLFVAFMGAGYLSALLQLHATHGSREDIVAAFHGSPAHTRLVTMARGDMRQHLASDAELATIERWAAAGSPRESWEPVRQVLAARCIRCHSEGKEKEDAPLDTFEGARAQTRVEPLLSERRLVALTHIHVLALGALAGLLGALFCATSWGPRVKLALVATPFLGMTLDFSGWWLARIAEPFCDLILAGGALTGLGLAGLVLGTLADLWVLPRLAPRA